MGKSLGTLAMAHLLSTSALLGKAEAVWITPLSSEDSVRERMRERAIRSLVIDGTRDPEYAPEALVGVEHLAIEGADHSVEIRGEAWWSLRAVERALRAIQVFVDAGGERTPTEGGDVARTPSARSSQNSPSTRLGE